MTTNLTVATTSGKLELYFTSYFAAKQTAKNGKEILRLTILRPFVGKQTAPKSNSTAQSFSLAEKLAFTG